MRPQRLQPTTASRDGRAECLARHRCTVQGDILIKIVEVGPIGIATERLRWSAIRENDVVAFKFDMKIFKSIRLHRAQPGDAASVDQIDCWYQKTIYKDAVLTGYVEIAVGQMAIERTTRDFDRSDFIIPRCLSVSLKAHAPDPLDRLEFA